MELEFDTFTVTLPPGWTDVLDDATYTDPDAALPIAFAADDGPGTLYVAPLLAETPSANPSDLEALVIEWGRRRGRRPQTLTRDSKPRAGVASGTFELGGEFVEVWMLSDGRSTLQVSYVCAWSDRDLEADARAALVASLRLL